MKILGGISYIDLSPYGAFTSGTAKTSQDVSEIFPKTQQTGKPVCITGLTIGTAKYAPAFVEFTSATVSTTTTATAIITAAKNVTIAITNTGSITVTKAS